MASVVPKQPVAQAPVDEPRAPSGKTLVMCATYNEIENLPQLIAEIFAAAPQVDFLAIDDNSPDGTGQWCDAQAAADRRIHCLHRTGKQGLGTAIVAGMQYAMQHGYDYVLNMDGDFSHHPRYLPAMLAGMEGKHLPRPLGEGRGKGAVPVDVMIGSRYIPGGGTVGWPLKRKLMSRAVNLYARWMLWLMPKDVSGGYRCYRVAKLRELPFDQIRSRGYSFQEEVLWLLRRRRARFGETPILFADRERGQSKINRGEAWEALRIILQLGLANLCGRSA
ncbi:MAG TPA: polyprenol monophosphomannose synthase [Pirellulales bacterium]|jgi:dolichol-phosphate mannosyltransferase|nr:polyprenol monophosphomannose synthase [Pirellulales bacterium]